ncbi:MAG: hypothetical protein N2035_07340 [Chthoniobacterales bacterium]|nr:hypothetical protein [Chthoniobacterales bacterium]
MKSWERKWGLVIILGLVLASLEGVGGQVFTKQVDSKWQTSKYEYLPVCQFDETIGQVSRRDKIIYPAVPFYASGMLGEESRLRLKLIGNFYTPDWEKTLNQIKRITLEEMEEQTPVLVKKGDRWEVREKPVQITRKTNIHYSEIEGKTAYMVEEKD